MRRIVMAAMGTISGLVLLFSYHTSTDSVPVAAAAAGSPRTDDGGTTTTPAPDASSDLTGSPSASTGSGATSGTFTGSAVDTRWGIVQVQITVADGKITKSYALQYPQGNGRDIEINNYALPVLAQEVVSAQNGSIDAITGATVTSEGYIQSLQSALDQAHMS